MVKYLTEILAEQFQPIGIIL